MNRIEKSSLVHDIPPADYHVRQMTEDELIWRFETYTGMQLSVAGPKPREVNVFSHPVLDVLNDDGRLGGTQSRSRISPKPTIKTRLPESEKEKPGPMAEAVCVSAGKILKSLLDTSA